MLGGLAGVGVPGFYYRQFTGDSGEGAVLGDFDGRALGVGPIVSYVRELLEDVPMSVEAKYMREFGVKHRLQGHIMWI